jgi:transcriptional regulator with AAA-type ATPase domain
MRHDNDIVLQVRGVSRHHARVSLQKGELTLEDLGSKNGTLANGVRIQRTRIEPGDKIGVGPVTLRLEEIDPDDARVVFMPEPLLASPDPGLLPQKTTDIFDLGSRASGGTWLSLVESLLTRLGVRPQADLAGVLALLVKELGVRGAGVFEWPRGSEPVVLAACGEIEGFSRQGLQGLMERAFPPGPAGAIASTTFTGDSALTCAVLEGPGSDRLALAVFGNTEETRSQVETLLRIVLGLIDRFRPQPVHVPRSTPPIAGPSLVFPQGYIPGESPAMASLYGQMQQLLQGDLPVLILGETGVGKEFLARTLHASSGRRTGPFVAINCAAIPADLLEAEMFGIGKGIATGVVERQGKFQLAEGGTLFLDEIGDMSLDLQAKLLRALQEKEIQPVGGAPVAVDIRVVAATNSDPLRRMEEGRFRRDLYYRVAGYALRVPPLREGKEDIPALVEGLMRAFAHEARKSLRGITLKALRALVEYPWPGNIRELQHEIRRLVYLCPDGQAIDSSMLSRHLFLPSQPAEIPLAEVGSLELDAQVQRMEASLIRQALARAGGNHTQAAKLLGVSRNGLAMKMERLGIKD